MTLNEITTAALAQLGRSTDSQTIETWRQVFTRYANDAIKDIAETMQLYRTDELPVIDGVINTADLPYCCYRVLSIDGSTAFSPGNSTEEITFKTNKETARVKYRYIPNAVEDPSIPPALPEHTHPLIVHYIVARERASGDTSTQSGSGIYFELYNAEKAKLRPHLGNPDAYKILNRW